MTGRQESRYTAYKLKSRAQRLLGDSDQRLVEFGETRIIFNNIALRRGNITSIIGSRDSPGNLFRDSTWNLKKPPIDPPDIAEMNRLAEILAIFL